MKIAHITFSLLNAGKENMMVDIANEQQKLGHDLSIIIINNNFDENIINRIDERIRVFKLKRKKASKSIIPFIKLFFILNIKQRFTIIHSHDIILGKILRFICRTKIVLTIHGPESKMGHLKFYKKLFAISKSVKQDVESRGNYKCKLVYNGIVTEQIEKKSDFVLDEFFNIILVKRLNHERKGQDLLIKAVDYLIKTKGYKNFKLYLVGSGESKKHLLQLIDDLNLNHNIFLLGNKNRDWIYKNLANYDLFVHPSRFEGFGLTVAEAMAAKIPIVSSNIEGPAEILNQGEFGIMFENNNIPDLADKIEIAYSLYKKNMTSEFVELAYHHCINNFNIKMTAQNYCTNYLSD